MPSVEQLAANSVCLESVKENKPRLKGQLMIDADYLRRQAESCLSLSRATFDLVIATRLRALAEEFRRKAQEIEDACAGFAMPRRNGNGARAGDSDRA
jgi:hypothetical protein